ncbi:MAG: efflux RND transporter permease subunit [Gammaproteobacteria bacterium]
MILSDLSVKRPVVASVLSLLLVIFGLVSFHRLPLREYPDIDPPVVSIETLYPGAAANVVETQITEIIEERIAGIEGIKFVESNSEDGRSTITIEFDIKRNIDNATNDVRDRVANITTELPDEAEPPEIRKVDSNDNVIMWLNLTSDRLTVPELTDYAERYLVDRFSVLDGVARIRIGGGQRYAMRIWLDRQALAARSLTVSDIEQALQNENVELPAGSIESIKRQFTVRVQRAFHTADEFAKLVIARGNDGYLIRLGDVARIERGTEEDRTFFRGNGVAMVGIGIIKQSTANTIDVARAALAAKNRINRTLPEGMTIEESYDTSLFVEQAITEVYKTFMVALLLVILVIYLFLGSLRATLIPAITIPVSIIATFIVLYILDYSVNLLTLLALVLAIGLVVDDAIVVLENIYRRIEEKKETPLVAAFRGTRQVGFAVVATTLVLVAVFIPITFLQGDLGRLFSEFAVTLAAAVSFSSIVALSMSPMLASKILRPKTSKPKFFKWFELCFSDLRCWYIQILKSCIRKPYLVIVVFVVLALLTIKLLNIIPSEYTPREDRGAFFVIVSGPEGASYAYIKEYMDEIERRLMPLVNTGEVTRLLVRAPRSFSNTENFSNGIVILVLNKWGQRRPAGTIMADVARRIGDLPGVQAFPVMRQGFGVAFAKPVQFVLGGGSSYQQLAQWRDILLQKMTANNPGFTDIDWDYKETKPQLDVIIDYNRAAELGVRIANIGQTLETMLGSRKVTTYIDSGEEYDVILEGERSTQRTPTNLANIYVRSDRSQQLIPLTNFVKIKEFADANSLNRYNRVRAITIEANLAENLSLGAGLNYLENLVKRYLPENVVVDYKGESRDFKFSSTSIVFIFMLGLIVVFLVLAAQFESFIHPFIIILTVPMAIVGALLGLWFSGNTLNVYSEVGLIVLIGLAAKNGILIVEFANQLRDRNKSFMYAILRASKVRFRPIVMTGITTAAGTIPLILAIGAGSETRRVIGIVMLCGSVAATLFTLFIAPVAYCLLARNTQSPQTVQRQLENEMATKT